VKELNEKIDSLEKTIAENELKPEPEEETSKPE
jgi:hypothetical protein